MAQVNIFENDEDVPNRWVAERFFVPNDQRVVVSPRAISMLFDTRDRLRPFSKPTGLWYSCGAAWVNWLHDEMPEWLNDINRVYTIKVDLSLMVVLRSFEDIVQFTEQYRTSRQHAEHIDWPAVAKHYDGIEICPYIWDARLNPNTIWYYPWDVASGCVWNPRAIKQLELQFTRLHT